MPRCRSVTCKARQGGPHETDVGADMVWDQEREIWVCPHCDYKEYPRTS